MRRCGGGSTWAGGGIVKLQNLPVVARNLAGRARRRLEHWVSARTRDTRALGKRTGRAAEALDPASSMASIGEAVRRAGVRTSRRAERFQQHVIAPMRDERAVLSRLRDIASGHAPIIVGPWISEVGYEVLYLVPFLRWFQDRYAIAPGRIVAVSRGGVGWWYDGIASTYVDVLDLYSPDAFASQAEARRSAGDQKQLEPSTWERDIVGDLRRRLGLAEPHVLHPGLMYRLFRGVWHGDRGLDFLMTHTEYARPRPPTLPEDHGLPAAFAAVKFYTGPALPDTPDTREQLRAAVARVAQRMPVISLDTGLGLDEHRDYLFNGVSGVLDLRDRMTPATNLAVQSRIMARASLYVGTCGSLAWLAPMLGVPTVAAYTDDRYLAAHLYAARYAYRRMGAARFSVVDLRALARLSRAA
jgi:hypothetical protein